MKVYDWKSGKISLSGTSLIQLVLLRLDFNGVLTAWRTGEEDRATSRNLLAEGGL